MTKYYNKKYLMTTDNEKLQMFINTLAEAMNKDKWLIIIAREDKGTIVSSVGCKQMEPQELMETFRTVYNTLINTESENNISTDDESP